MSESTARARTFNGGVNAVVIDAVRTPIGRYGGALAKVRPDDLAAVAIRGLIDRTGIDAGLIDDVLLGCTNQAGEDNRNVGRLAGLLAGLPVTVPGQTINRLCGSGMQAVISAFHTIRAGEGSIFVSGGVESMTRSPWVALKSEDGFSRIPPLLTDSTIGWRFVNPALREGWTISMGETAEKLAHLYGITREAQDEFAYESQMKTAAAVESGRFEREIIQGLLERDEHPRPGTTLERLASLQPAFTSNGTVTAGSSSGINDGAAALLIAEEETADSLGLPKMARILGSAVVGVPPEIMGIGPAPAIQLALSRANLTIDEIDLFEINEAFAAQVLACVQELAIDMEKLNVNGGGIALGHPLGASGARISTTLLHEMKRSGARYGVAAMCVGVGQGIATVYENV